VTMHRSISRVVAQVGDLPAVPSVVRDVLRLTEDPAVAMSSLSEIIQSDPALTAKILRVSNSPHYGMRQYVGTLKLALVVLGVREVRNIVIGIAMFDSLRDSGVDFLLAEDFWNHSLMVAALSRKIGTAFNMGFQGEDFLAGLLHDVGKMVLTRYLGERYEQVDMLRKTKECALYEAENERLGFNHADAGAALVSKWDMPKSLSEALYYHHPGNDRPLTHAQNAGLVSIVRIANLAARFPFRTGNANQCPACLDKDAWAVLALHGAPVETAARFEMLGVFAAALEQSPKIAL